ncbi:MAG: SGNH/GDSL hydrolase family protein [Christensenellaceae bacterium]
MIESNTVTQITADSESPKRIIFFGDSIMRTGDTQPGRVGSGSSVPSYVSQYLPQAEVYNFAIGGTTLAKWPSVDGTISSTGELSMQNWVAVLQGGQHAPVDAAAIRAQLKADHANELTALMDFEFRSGDIFCIAYGANDFGYIRDQDYETAANAAGSPLRTVGDFRTAMREVVQCLKANFSDSPIVLISPIWRGGNTVYTQEEKEEALQRGETLEDNVWDSTSFIDVARSVPLKYTNLVCAIEDVAEEEDVFFCNDYHLADWETKEIYYEAPYATNDYVHPEIGGRQRMADHIAKYLHETMDLAYGAIFFTVQFVDTWNGEERIFQAFEDVQLNETIRYNDDPYRLVPAPTRDGYTFYGWRKAYPESGQDPYYEPITADTVFTVIWHCSDGTNQSGTATGLLGTVTAPDTYTVRLIGRGDVSVPDENGTASENIGVLYERTYQIATGDRIDTVLSSDDLQTLQEYEYGDYLYSMPSYFNASGALLTNGSQDILNACYDENALLTLLNQGNTEVVYYLLYTQRESLSPAMSEYRIQEMVMQTMTAFSDENRVRGILRLNTEDYRTVSIGSATTVGARGTFESPTHPTFYDSDDYPSIVVRGINGSEITELGTAFHTTYAINSYDELEIEIRVFADNQSGATITLNDIVFTKDSAEEGFALDYLNAETRNYYTNANTRTTERITIDTADFNTMKIASLYFERCYPGTYSQITYPSILIRGNSTENGDTVWLNIQGSALKNAGNSVSGGTIVPLSNVCGSALISDGELTCDVSDYDSVTIEATTNTQEGASVVRVNGIRFI